VKVCTYQVRNRKAAHSSDRVAVTGSHDCGRPLADGSSRVCEKHLQVEAKKTATAIANAAAARLAKGL
jgi:hypothetical protein